MLMTAAVTAETGETELSDTYQGHPNYETWLVHLWLGNDEGLYRNSREAMMRAHIDSEDVTAALKRFVEGELPKLPNGLGADLLKSAVDRVDWQDIASNWIEEETE